MIITIAPTKRKAHAGTGHASVFTGKTGKDVQVDAVVVFLSAFGLCMKPTFLGSVSHLIRGPFTLSPTGFILPLGDWQTRLWTGWDAAGHNVIAGIVCLNAIFPLDQCLVVEEMAEAKLIDEYLSRPKGTPGLLLTVFPKARKG